MSTFEHQIGITVLFNRDRCRGTLRVEGRHLFRVEGRQAEDHGMRKEAARDHGANSVQEDEHRRGKQEGALRSGPDLLIMAEVRA